MQESKSQFIQTAHSFSLGKLTRRFHFNDEIFTYTLSDMTGEKSVDIPYESVDLKNKQTIIIKNSQYRRRLFIVLVFIWGLAASLLGYYASPFDVLAVSLILGFSSIKLFLSTLGDVRKTVFKGERRDIEILQDEQHDEIINQIKTHWLNRHRVLYANINPLKPIEQEINKFEWLKSNKVISEQEFLRFMQKLQNIKHENKNTLVLKEELIN